MLTFFVKANHSATKRWRTRPIFGGLKRWGVRHDLWRIVFHALRGVWQSHRSNTVTTEFDSWVAGKEILLVRKSRNLILFFAITISLQFLNQTVLMSQEAVMAPVSTQTGFTPLRIPRTSRTLPNVIYGIASWYSESDPNINKHTANGEIFDDSKLTCASWDFSFGTKLKIINLDNGKSVVCRVNDRGPSKRLQRLVDLSQASFKKISNLKLGLINVSVTPVSTGTAVRKK